MTTFAFEILYFVKHIGYILFSHIEMAFYTGNLLVFPVEPEGGFIVVKSGYFPNRVLMASRAIGYSVGFKLFVMIIIMAACTGSWKIRKNLVIFSCAVLFKMALATI